jgi:hypothetical protein
MSSTEDCSGIRSIILSTACLVPFGMWFLSKIEPIVLYLLDVRNNGAVPDVPGRLNRTIAHVSEAVRAFDTG